MKKWEWGALFLIFIFAYVLRVWFLPQKALTFGYDQARDAFVTEQIIAGDWKILGPPASTPGLYHGVFYYYYLIIPYLFGASPINAAYWNAIFNAAVVFIVYWIAFLMTKKKLSGFLAAFLFSISFEATQYATWLSNPTLGVWTVPLMYLGLWLWLNKKNKWSPILTAFGLGLSIQSEIFLAYHIVPLLIWLLISKAKIKRLELVVFGLTLIATLSTMILVEFKFGFQSLKGLQALAVSQDSNLAYAKSIGDYLILYLNQIGRIFAFNSYPGNIGYAGGFVILLALYGTYLSLKQKGMVRWGAFLATWLFSHFTVVTVGGTSTPFLMVGIGPAVSIVIAVYLERWWRVKKQLLVLAALSLFFYGNISMILRENIRGATLFAIQKDMILKNEIAAVDYIYKSAEGKSFSINTLTSPLWINNVWAYIFAKYGKPTYGYLPEWHGQDQVGQLAEEILPDTSGSTNLYYLLLEPMGGIPRRFLDETVASEDIISTLLEEKSFGELIVQKRWRRN